jgi:hypothetical protein
MHEIDEERVEVLCRLILRKFFTSRVKQACRVFLEKQKGLSQRNKLQRSAIHQESRAILVTGSSVANEAESSSGKKENRKNSRTRLPVAADRVSDERKSPNDVECATMCNRKRALPKPCSNVRKEKKVKSGCGSEQGGTRSNEERKNVVEFGSIFARIV